jgi:hypothetical protein
MAELFPIIPPLNYSADKLSAPPLRVYSAFDKVLKPLPGYNGAALKWRILWLRGRGETVKRMGRDQRIETTQRT